MTLTTLILRYSLFAVLATIANLGTQRLILSEPETVSNFALAVFFGTGVGLVVKYLLDKRWIFQDRSEGLRDHSKKFTLYTATGVFTTLIFWGTEYTFWALWSTTFARELGALLGLSAGYILKYQMDRRFVFADLQRAAS